MGDRRFRLLLLPFRISRSTSRINLRISASA